MMNADATRYLRDLFRRAGLPNHLLTVYSRDMVTADRKGEVRSAVAVAGDDDMPQRLADKIRKVIDDVPGLNSTEVNDTHVIFYWSGGA